MNDANILNYIPKANRCLFLYYKLEKKWVTIAPYTVLSDYLAYILHNKFLKSESQR